METRLRLTLVLGGLPRPVTQHRIYDHTGRFVARVDLAYPELRIAIEYDGENHKERWAEDMVRQNRIIGAGWTLMRYTNRDVVRRSKTVVAQVDAARCAALAA
jgi:very-short-patch-repair endonuclease